MMVVVIVVIAMAGSYSKHYFSFHFIGSGKIEKYRSRK